MINLKKKKVRRLCGKLSLIVFALAIICNGIVYNNVPEMIMAADDEHVHTGNCYAEGTIHSHTGNTYSYGGCYTKQQGGYWTTCYLCGGSGTQTNSSHNITTSSETVVEYEDRDCGENKPVTRTYTTYTCTRCGASTSGVTKAVCACGATYYNTVSKPSGTCTYNCSNCNGSGKEWNYYYDLNCGKEAGHCYNGSTEIMPVCGKVVTSLSAKETVQEIVIGEQPNLMATAVFLDGHTEEVECILSDFDDMLQNETQIATLSYGEYSGTAKNAKPATTTISIYIIGTYNITFDAAGGEVAIEDKSVTYADTYGELPTPVRQGFSFEGWYIEDTDILITEDSVVTTRNNHVLKAHWTRNSYTINVTGIDGSDVMQATYEYEEPVEISAGAVVGKWFKEWQISSNDDIEGFDTLSDTAAFNMPAHDVTISAVWGNIINVEAKFNETLYNAYEYNEQKGFNIDSGNIIVNNNMVDMIVTFDDGEKVKVTNTGYYMISPSEISNVGETEIKVKLLKTTKSDGSTYDSILKLTCYSAELSNVMEGVNIGSYEELAEYVSKLKGRYDTLSNNLSEYEKALERYKEQLNTLDFNDIVLTTEIENNISSIEEALRLTVEKLADCNTELEGIKEALTAAGYGEEEKDDLFENILLQIIEMGEKRKLAESRLSELNNFIAELKELLELTDTADLNDITEAIGDMKAQLDSKKAQLEEYEEAISKINEMLGFSDSEEEQNELEKQLDEAVAGVSEIKTDLESMSNTLVKLIDKTGEMINGSENKHEESLEGDIFKEIEELTDFTEELRNNIENILCFVNEIKVIFGITAELPIDKVMEELEKVKVEYDGYMSTIEDIMAVVGTATSGAINVDLNKACEDVIELQDRLGELENMLKSELGSNADTSSAEAVRKTINDMRAELVSSRLLVESLKQSNLDAEAVIAVQEAKLNELMSQLGEEQVTSGQLDRTLSEKQSQLNILNISLSEIQDSIAKKVAMIEEKKKNIVTQENTISSLSLQITTIRDENAIEVQLLNEKILELEEALEKLQFETDTLKKSYDEHIINIKSDSESLKATTGYIIDEKENQIERLENELISINEYYEILKSEENTLYSKKEELEKADNSQSIINIAISSITEEVSIEETSESLLTLLAALDGANDRLTGNTTSMIK